MALTDIVNVSISLETQAVSQAGFGTPIFIGAHRWFNERVRSYTSIEAAEADIPTGSEEYAALQAFFSQIPAPSIVEVGRREADAILAPQDVEENAVYELTITDNASPANVEAISYTAAALDDEEGVVDGLIAAIDASSVAPKVNATKTGTGASAVLELSPVDASTDSFALSAISSNLETTFSTSEAAADVLVAIEEEGSDAYFVTAHDHTEVFVLAMAAAVESRQKVYFLSTDEQGALDALADPATDILGKLAENNYFRTAGLFHQDADESFPECAFVGKGAPFDPGTLTWANKRLAGVSASADPSTGNRLTFTQRSNLYDRNANFIERVGGQDITRPGKTAGGEFIDVIRSRDFLVARITEAYQNKLINTPKVPYTDSGITAMRSVLTSTLNRYVSSDAQPNILQENNSFTTTFPRATDVSFADKSARVLNASFTAFLAGAIHVVNITGNLTLEAQS